MRVREFFIDRFGVLRAQHVPHLSPGITIFLGDNEAGKSTCLNFFRAMLFGYARNRKSIDYLADAKAASGGGLLIESEALGVTRLTRNPGPHGGPFALTNPDGSPRPDSDLALLLRGCTPEIYDKVFAFSLSELAHFGSLTDDKVRHALHGAAFGAGLRSPGQVLKELDDAMRRIFAPRATSSKIHGLLRELDAINAAVRERGNEVERYAALRAELEEAERELGSVRASRLGIEGERRMLERKIALRRRWDALREAEDALAAFPETRGTFTPDGRERLDRLTERLEDRKHAFAAARFALERAEKEAAAAGFDAALAAETGTIFSLSERKESMRETASRIHACFAEKDSFARIVAEACTDLGPGWNAAALEACDLSLASHEQCAVLGQRVTAAEQALFLAENESERVSRELAAAESACEDARARLRDVGDSGAETLGADADDTALDKLAQLVTRAVDAHEKNGAFALAARNAEHALDQAVAALDPKWSRQDLERAEVAPKDRERLLQRARAVTETRRIRVERERETHAASAAHEDAQARVSVRESSIAGLLASLPGGGVGADAAAALDARRRVARRAQTARRALETAQADYAAANEQLGDIASLVRGVGAGNAFPWATVVLFLAALCLVCGGGLLYLGLEDGGANVFQGGIGSLAAGAALGVSWLVLAARNGNGASETMERNWTAIEQRLVRTRIAAHAARMEAEEALGACAAEAPDIFPGGVVDADALAEAEQVLARQREACAVLEREQREFEREKTASEAARKRLNRVFEEAEAARRDEAAACAEWESALAAMRLPADVEPEDARSFLERLDAALGKRAGVLARLADQKAALETIGECLRFARSFPDLADAFASLPEPESHLAPDHGPWLLMTQEHLARRRGEGRERIRLRELLAARMARCDELGPLRNKAGAAVVAARSALGAAREEWRSWLTDKGFSVALSPETARRAMESAAKARAALEGARRMDARIAALCGDVAMFAKELLGFDGFLREQPAWRDVRMFADTGDASAIAENLSGMAAVLALLDELSAAAREAGEKAAICRARARELPDLRDAATLAEEQEAAVRAAMENMLRLAECNDPEEYRAAYAVWEKREAALAAMRTHKAALEREGAEAGLAFADLALAFAALSREEADLELAALEETFAAALAREHALAERKGGLDAAMSGLLSEKGLEDLLARRESFIAAIEDSAAEWSRFAVARELLLTAKSRFESERQTGVARTAGEMFSAVTRGAYSGLAVSLDDESVAAITRDGAVKNPETELSRGTREQLYLALRLAYVQDHGAQAEALPVVMDDILVNFDARRARNTAAVLASFAASHQILFFTCHKWVATLLEEASPDAVRYGVDKGVFTRADR